ncbi:2',5'-phosphodiesterase 12 [Liparis tanakae]|uniref:2',5'-phosphodiesterase 12 n=1 Tax=Liparis tanakae TaxID=230148 RepID=A0A4Z2FUK8_9TELE|nr:2',5'-phosphodiesterase 12 [Liparis tanakae]
MFRRLPAFLALLPRRLLLASSSPRTLTGAPRRMEPAAVRCLPGEPKLTISFRLDGANRCMLRDQDEPLGKALARISHGLNKSHEKARKSKKKSKGQTPPPQQPPPPPAVKLHYAGEEVADTVPNSAAWRDGAELRVGDVTFAVRRNAPTLVTAELPGSLLAGFPVCPHLRVEFGTLEDCEVTWYKENAPNASPAAAAEPPCWTEVGRGRVHVPSNHDIGLRLKLRCTPRDGGGRVGEVKELVSAGAVEAGPGACSFDNRHPYTVREAAWPVVRVATYNILADVYAQTELSKTVLYPYCAPYALQLDYRQSLIKKELAGYNADILCLQEVDTGVFTDSLTPALDAFGLEGVFRIKEKQHEGPATFYRSVLEDLNKPGRQVCVANTHLYWHPKGGNLRLIQMGVAMRHLSHVISEVAPGAPLVFCGDFNSSPHSGVFQLLSETEVPPQHADWSSSGPEEACSMELRSAFPPLLSACGQPAYTNYVGGFHGCLDYIFIQPGSMQVLALLPGRPVEQVIPLPSHQEVTTHEALPSVAHPSDHIALICDLRWNP